MEYGSISDAINLSSAGDVIAVSAGTYSEDFPKIFHSLTIKGVGGLAHLVPVGIPSNGQGVLVIDAPEVTLDHLEISGGVVNDGNGAGIRFESGSVLNVTNSWLHDNQDGILANSVSGAVINIDKSEFDHNGAGDGYTHNIYINNIARLNVTNSYFHDAIGGHEIKSRAQVTVIENNRIADGPTSNTSYQVDLPNGGDATISGNSIEKGENSPNKFILHYGGELSPVYAGSSLTIDGNDITDNATNGVPVALLNQATDADGNPIPVTLSNNDFHGVAADQVSNEAVTGSGNTFNESASPALRTEHPFSVACYCPGTHIAAPGGEIAIEALRIGDLVTTHSGEAATVRWIGHRSYDADCVAANPQLRPVRVRAHALAAGVPSRDLLISPEHGLLAGGVLIPAAALVNGVSVTRVDGAVSYLHLELACHELVIAEGCPAETFVDHASRALFNNAAEFAELYPEQGDIAPSMCLPRLHAGPEVDAEWARIAARAEIPELAAASDGELHGHVERVSGGVVEGWALDGDQAVRLEVLIDNAPVFGLTANAYRSDLDHAGLNDGRCGFRMRLPVGAANVRVRRVGDLADMRMAS